MLLNLVILYGSAYMEVEKVLPVEFESAPSSAGGFHCPLIGQKGVGEVALQLYCKNMGQCLASETPVLLLLCFYQVLLLV